MTSQSDSVLERHRLLVLIVAYEASKFISKVLEKLTPELFSNNLIEVEILILDDCSSDNILDVIKSFLEQNPWMKITFARNKFNLGYGGNQKVGYLYAIRNSFDSVVLLHGDGQYPAERILDITKPILDGEADVVLGSRMIDRFSALKGRMPLYKWVGNIVLTSIQNKLLGMKLSEFHTGFRAYRVEKLSKIPFELNSDYFDFDTQILIQLNLLKAKFLEISIPTYYGEEISRVNGIVYGLKILRDSLKARFIDFGLREDPKFQFQGVERYERLKLGFPSSHQYALDNVRPSSNVLDLGGGTGAMAHELVKLNCKVRVVEKFVTEELILTGVDVLTLDLDSTDLNSLKIFEETTLLLDVLEHSSNPDTLLAKLRAKIPVGGTMIITTPNVAFIGIRIQLLFGKFNYTNKGILDRDHKRLFTRTTVVTTVERAGFEILEIVGVPAPLEMIFGNRFLLAPLYLLNRFLVWVMPRVFSYQFALKVRVKESRSYSEGDFIKLSIS